MMRVFKDRHDAGAQLARSLHRYADASDAVVLAHTRTSVPVAYEVATRLGLPLALLDDDELSIEDKTVLLIDDGDNVRQLAIAIEQQRNRGAASVAAGVAVASPQCFAMLHAAADHVSAVLTPQRLFSIEAWYADLAEPTEDDVRSLLVAAAQNLLRVRRSNFLTSRVDT